MKSREQAELLLEALDVADYMKEDMLNILVDCIELFGKGKGYPRDSVSLGAAHLLLSLATEIAYASGWTKESFLTYAGKIWDVFDLNYKKAGLKAPTTQGIAVTEQTSNIIKNKDGAN